MSYSLPVNVTIILSFIIFIFFLLGIHNILTSFSENDCEMTFMFQYPQFVEISLPAEVQKNYPKYALYGYGEGGITQQLRKMKFKGIPVLFIPGSSGSHKQGRSLASISLRKSLNSRTPFHFNYFMIDFNEEQAAVYGGVLEDQRKFASFCIKKILSLYNPPEGYKKPESVILIGHSLGGLLAKGVFLDADFDPKLVNLMISVATPHKYALIQPDHYIASYYKNVKSFWENNSELQHITHISIGGGLKDIIVRSDVTVDRNSDINVLTTAIPGVWLPNDHLSIMWCKQLILTLVRAMFDSVDMTTKQLSTDQNHINSVFQYHLLKRHAGKKFSGSMTSRFSSFDRNQNWFENLQRQFTITEPKGVKSNHYIMIRLFSDPKSEAVFIEGYNINVRDWIFVCNADLVFNSIRMCETGENLSNMSEIAPVDTGLKSKRKFIYLNLHELKAKLHTHVLVRFPPSDSHMSVNVDVHQPSERNINFQTPKFYSVSSQTVISSTQNGSVHYSINLVGFEYIWQSYALSLEALSCKTGKNNAVVSFIVPWANEDQHFFTRGEKSLVINLNLISPKPKNYNSSSHPFARLHLDPTCNYQVSIHTSIVGIFAQGARFYSLMLPAFIATVIILTLRHQMICLDEGKSLFYLSALSSAVRRYYIILQATILGSKILGLELCLLILPVPDFFILQEVNLDSFFLTMLLYAVAIIISYSLGAAVYVAIVVSGQAAHKMALKFVAKSISGVFNWSEWVISAMHQLPIIVLVILISLSLSTSGALGLWLGAFFYFLKLGKMYEDYLDDWFNYSVKLIAKKVKDVIVGKPKSDNKNEDNQEEKKKEETTNSTENKEEESTNSTENKESNVVEKIESNVSQTSSDTAVDAVEEDNTVDALSAIHFHISIFLIWVLIALLYVPSLLMWAKNYHFSILLEKDPAVIPSIIVNACGAVLWQSGVPRSCKKFSVIRSSSLFLLAVIGIIYATVSLYRLGYILSASLVIVSVDQILAKHIS